MGVGCDECGHCDALGDVGILNGEVGSNEMDECLVRLCKTFGEQPIKEEKKNKGANE